MRIQLRTALLVLISLLSCAHASTAQTLWMQAKYGMTSAEVSAAVPGAVVLPAERQQRLYNGATELVRGPPIAFIGEQFEPSFYFLNDMLTQVIVGMRGVSDSGRAQRVFQNLTSAFRAIYGREVASARAEMNASAEWRSGAVKISTSLYTIGAPLLNIVYQVDAGADARK